MVRMVVSALAVLALLPVIWVSSAVWATGLAAGLAAHEMRRRFCKSC